MASPALKAVGTVSIAAVSPSVAWPAGTVAGDFALLIVNTRNEAISAPSGWTQISASPQGQGTLGTSGSSSGLSIFWKFAAGSDPNVTVTSSSFVIGVIVTYSGVDAATPVNASAGQSNATSTTITYPAATTTAANCLLVQAVSIAQGGGGGLGTPTVPAGDTQDLLVSRMAVYHGPATTPGSYGSATSAVSTSYVSSTITLALTPEVTTTPISGGTSFAFTASGSLSAGASLAGSVSLALGTSGTLTGTVVPDGALQGHTSLSFDTVGTLSADAALSGNASLAFGASGTLVGYDFRAISGSAAMQFSASGKLTGTAIGVLRGAASMVFAASAKLTLHQPSQFYQLFADVYLKRQALLNAILTAARILATAPQDVPADVQAQIDAAEAAANAANAELAAIASDGILSPVEKPTVIRDNNVIVIERAGIDLQAAAFGVVAEKNTYDNAVVALSAYLATLTNPVAWNDLSGDTTIDGATFRQKFADVYTSRQACLNAIYAAAKIRADAAQATADTATALVSQVAVLNPGFDAGDTGWDMEGGWSIRMDNASPGVGPGYAQHIGSSANQTTALRNRARCYVIQGQSYKVQALIQGISANGQCFARISWRDANDLEVSLTLGNPITGTVVNGSYAVGKPPSNAVYAHAEIATSAHTSGTYKVDNVVSTLQPATADEIAETAAKKWAGETGATVGANWASNLTGVPQATGGNLVQHGDFNFPASVETWSGDGTLSYNYPGGTFAAAMSTSSRDTYETNNFFPVVGGEVLYVAAQVAAGSVAAQFGVQFMDASGTPGWVPAVSRSAGASWAYLQGTITVPSTAIKARPWIGQNITAGSRSSTAYAAQINIQKTALATPGSGLRLGDARNQAMVTVGNLGAAWSGLSVTYSSTSTSATLTASPALLQMGSASVAYNGGSTTVSGSAGATVVYYLYYTDPAYGGGTKTLTATPTYINSINDDGRVYLGSVSVTYPTSGTGGGTGGGGGPCPLREAWVIKYNRDDAGREFVRAGSVAVGDYLLLVSGDWGLVSYSMPALTPCVRIGIGGIGCPYTLGCSTTAPIGLADGGQVLAPDALGGDALVMQSYPQVDTHITSVQDIGERWVQHITCENDFFWTGDSPNCLFAHHNLKMIP